MSVFLTTSSNALVVHSTTQQIPDILFNNESSYNPVGSIITYAGETSPDGWLLCDGNQISRTTYARLFNVIGTRYGSPSSSDVFCLPDLRDRIPIGKPVGSVIGDIGGRNTMSLTATELPAHTHTGTTGEGGQHTHTITVDDGGQHSHGISDPGHNHWLQTVNDDFNNSGGAGPSFAADSAGTMNWPNVAQPSTTGITINSGGLHSHTASAANSSTHAHTFTTDSTGAGESFSIQNKYIVLNYIIKI